MAWLARKAVAAMKVPRRCSRSFSWRELAQPHLRQTLRRQLRRNLPVKIPQLTMRGRKSQLNATGAFAMAVDKSVEMDTTLSVLSEKVQAQHDDVAQRVKEVERLQRALQGGVSLLEEHQSKMSAHCKEWTDLVAKAKGVLATWPPANRQ